MCVRLSLAPVKRGSRSFKYKIFWWNLRHKPNLVIQLTWNWTVARDDSTDLTCDLPIQAMTPNHLRGLTQPPTNSNCPRQGMSPLCLPISFTLQALSDDNLIYTLFLVPLDLEAFQGLVDLNGLLILCLHVSCIYFQSTVRYTIY